MRIMRFYSLDLHFLWRARVLAFLAVFVVGSRGLNTDGVLLLSFKYCVLSDPLRVLESWHYADDTPCSWRGVTCGGSGLPAADGYSRVTALSIPSSLLLGSIPADLGMIEYLRRLDLSNNSLNGSLPASIFDAKELQVLDLSNNLISGELPDSIGQLQSLESLNLSDNALAGKLPNNLRNLRNLTTLSLKNNYISGGLPGGLTAVQVLDLSSNLINGSLPADFGGDSVRYLNVSYNKLSGEIPVEFSEKIPDNATIDLSYNNLAGKIPESQVLSNQETRSFWGNPDLCGDPANSPCSISSSSPPSPLPSAPTSPPAIAALPKIDSTKDTTDPQGSNSDEKSGGLRAGTIIAIVIGDIAGIAILSVIFLYVYQFKRNRAVESKLKQEARAAKDSWSESESESKHITAWSCLRKGGGDDGDSSDTASSSDEEDQRKSLNKQESHDQSNKTSGTLVTVDGEKELELETLLKASAYILGATGSSITYKAVLEDGTALAVRRIGENSFERFRNFESQVRAIAKLVHPNLVRIRGFYWGSDEKLVIYDYVPNGSLANARYRKVGSSPSHIPWEVRLKIAKGMARGLSYLHEKKHVHGNLKPSNILLGSDMEPKIGDFGLERLFAGDTSYKAGGSARNFGSKRSTASRESFPDHTPGPIPSPSPSPSPSSVVGCLSPYHAPESLRSIKPNSKWDVYAFGVILLELLTGKVVVLDELGQGLGLGLDDKARVLRMADVAIRADLEGKEEWLMACFKLGYSCASQAPQKRPQMREAVQVLEKVPCSSYYGHSL